MTKQHAESPDLDSVIHDHYPFGHEGSEYASFLCDFMLWCRRHRISPLRLAIAGFNRGGGSVQEDMFPHGWKISAWIEDKPERLPDAERDVAREHRDRIARFEGVLWKMFKDLDSEEPALNLLSLFYSSINDWDVMYGYLRASSEQWLNLLPWGAISGEQWYTIGEVRRLLKDHTTANRAFFELGANPSVPDATVAGSQLIQWVMDNGEKQGDWQNES